MQKFSDAVLQEFEKRNKYCIPCVEIYPRTVEDIVSIGAPASAIGRFSPKCFTWTNSQGSFLYKAKILSFPEISTYLADKINSAEVKFGNAERGTESMTRFVLDNKIKGCWMVIRLVFPDSPEDSVVLFWGKCDRPGEISNSTLSITASQDLGNYKQEIPFRTYQASCPLEFARPLGGCLGNQILTEKSLQFQAAVKEFGSSGCNKTFTNCSVLDNTNYFQGQRIVAVSGQFSYITVEEVVKRILFWTKRKKIQVVKTDNWSSVNQSEGSETVPLAFGRCQIQGHPITWADVGEQVKSLQGFCEGRISAFTFVRSRTQGINIIQKIEHLGDWGSFGTQTTDIIFNGVSGVNSRLAYLELVTDGSNPTQVDDAPIITAVIRGLEIPVPDPSGNFIISDFSNNPAYITRFLLNDIRFGRIPESRLDNDACLRTGALCDTLVEDRSGDEAIVLPANEATNYGIGYRRFRSAGRYSAYRDRFAMDPFYPNGPPEFEEPEIRWFNPFQQYTVPVSNNILRQKYTCNGALQEKTSVLDFIYKRILPTFKGWINYSPNGKIQIRTREKADNAYLRTEARPVDDRISISNIGPWRKDRRGYVVVGVSLETAELRSVKTFYYSTACNDLPITATNNGTVTATTSGTMSGGSDLAPAFGYIDIAGTVSAGSQVVVSFNSGDNLFTISYMADGVEDLPCFTRMLCAFLNANLQFQQDLIAYISPNNLTRINIRCESGFLHLNKPLEFVHSEAEEILRVEAVFENCGELTSNESRQFDNIVADSFLWNTNEEDEVNAVTAKYTSAIDDFHLTNLLPRAAWDTIDLEGQLEKEELDLTFVDNYWQAAYLTKSRAIERIDGNLHFTWKAGLQACQLELGDVVAIRHDSGDGALNYIPVSIEAIQMDLNGYRTAMTGRLYLSAAFDLRVQPIDPLLTTTLNPSNLPVTPPSTIGSNGGVSQSTPLELVVPVKGYYDQFGINRYSPDGSDRV